MASLNESTDLLKPIDAMHVTVVAMLPHLRCHANASQHLEHLPSVPICAYWTFFDGVVCLLMIHTVHGGM